MTDPRALFGVHARDGAAAEEAILDAVEGADIADDDWDWLLWRRGSAVYAIISAPFRARAAVAADERLRVLPVAGVAERMEDNRNTWVTPRPTAALSALEVARQLVERWMDSQFPRAAAETAPPPRRLKERTRIASRAEVYTRAQHRSSRDQQRAENLIARLSLDTARDSSGRGFTFVKRDSAPEE